MYTKLIPNGDLVIPTKLLNAAIKDIQGTALAAYCQIDTPSPSDELLIIILTRCGIPLNEEVEEG